MNTDQHTTESGCAGQPRTITSTRPRAGMRRTVASVAALSVVVAACGSDADSGDDRVAITATPTTTTAPEPAPSGAISDERCEANRAVGPVTFITSFDYAPSAGIAELIVADANGYFEERCIDVEIQTGFAPSNGGLVLEGQAQMSMAGSFSELVANNVAADGDLVALLHWGRTSAEELVIAPGRDVSSFGELCDSVVGIKGDLPYSLQAALALAGAERGCFEELPVEGFDPVVHLELELDALPVYKSNEPFQLDNAGIEYTTLDPLDFNVPSSFGIPFTSQSFLDANPDTVEDIVWALIKGYQDAAADPQAAVDAAFVLIDAAGNPNFFAPESELNRWTVESELIASLAPSGVGVGIPDPTLLREEIDAMVVAGVFESTPDWESMVDPTVAEGLYDGVTLNFPPN